MGATACKRCAVATRDQPFESMRNPVPDFTLVLTFMLPASFLLAVWINGHAGARLHLCFDFHVASLLSVSRPDPWSRLHPPSLVF